MDAYIPEPLALRIPEAARASGLSRATLYKLMAEGSLRGVKVAGRRLIPMSELRRLVGEAA